MEIDVRARGSVEIVVVSGPGTPGGVASIRERFKKLIGSGESLFILNLSRSPVLTSACLGELVAIRERVRKHDGVIKLVVNTSQRDLIVASRLDQLFQTFADEDEALDSFEAWTTTAGIP